MSTRLAATRMPSRSTTRKSAQEYRDTSSRVGVTRSWSPDLDLEEDRGYGGSSFFASSANEAHGVHMTALSMHSVQPGHPQEMPHAVQALGNKGEVIDKIKWATKNARKAYNEFAKIYAVHGSVWPGFEVLQEVDAIRKEIVPEITKVSREYIGKIRSTKDRSEKKRLRKEKTEEESKLYMKIARFPELAEQVIAEYKRFAGGTAPLIKVFKAKIPKQSHGREGYYKSVDVLHWCFRSKYLIMQAIYLSLESADESGRMDQNQKKALELQRNGMDDRILLFHLRKRLRELSMKSKGEK